MTKTVAARRFEHYLDAIFPLSASSPLIWLQSQHRRLVALDRTTGERMVDEELDDPPEFRAYRVDGRRVFLASRTRTELTNMQGRTLRQSRAHEPVAELTLPDELGTGLKFLVHGDDHVWVAERPKRGDIQLRLVRFNTASGRFDARVEVNYPVAPCAVAIGTRLVLFNTRDCRVDVFQDASREQTFSVQSGFQDELAGQGQAFAFKTSYPSEGHSLVRISVFRFHQGMWGQRDIALQARGTTSIAMTEDDLVVVDGRDLLCLTLDELFAAPDSQVTLNVVNVLTPAPRSPLATGTVSFIGEATGWGWVDTTAGKKLRFSCSSGDPVKVGDDLAIEAMDDHVVWAWHPLQTGQRCLNAGQHMLDIIELDELNRLLATRYPAPHTAASPPSTAYRTSVWYQVSLVELDSEEPETDPKVLMNYDGLEEEYGDIYEYANEDDFDDALGLVSVLPVLRFGMARKDLRFAFEFYSHHQPTEEQERQIIAYAERFMDGGWGGNYEFAAVEGYQGLRIHIVPCFQEIETTRTAAEAD